VLISANSWGSWLMILVALLVLSIVAWRILVMKRHRIARFLTKAVSGKRGQGQIEGKKMSSAKIYVTATTGEEEEEEDDEERGLALLAFGLDEVHEHKQALPSSIKAPPPPGLPPSISFRSSVPRPQSDLEPEREPELDAEAGLEQDDREARPSRKRRSDKSSRSRARSRSRSRRVKAVSIKVADLLVGLDPAELARLSSSPEELQARLEEALGRGIRNDEVDEGAEKEADDTEEN